MACLIKNPGASWRVDCLPACSTSYAKSLSWARCSASRGRVRLGASSTTVVPAVNSPSAAGSGQPTVVRKLIMLRHADSETSPDVRDHDRAISAQGKQEALGIAQRLKNVGWVPDLVLASNAKRTKQTLDEMASVIQALEEVDSHYYGSLYTVAALDGQTRQHLQECLLEVVDDDKNFCVMLVGHNKGWEEAASSLAGQAVKLKTASAALLQVAANSWSEVLKQEEETAWQLVDVLTPMG